MTSRIHIQNVSQENHIPSAHLLRRWIRIVLKNQGRENTELTLRIVEKEEIAALNQTYRKKTGPTNVLSFPCELPAEIDLQLLGDIVICAAIVKEEALEQNKSLEAHWAHMVIHGTLHLLNYDHVEESDAQKMESLEIILLKKLGYPNPYGVN